MKNFIELSCDGEPVAVDSGLIQCVLRSEGVTHIFFHRDPDAVTVDESVSVVMQLLQRVGHEILYNNPPTEIP